MFNRDERDKTQLRLRECEHYDETICFSWIVWPSKEARDAGMKKVFADERMRPENNPMPYDGKRLIYGGFETLVEL